MLRRQGRIAWRAVRPAVGVAAEALPHRRKAHEAASAGCNRRWRVTAELGLGGQERPVLSRVRALFGERSKPRRDVTAQPA